MTVRVTRRRVITILAAAAGLPLLLRAGKAEAKLARWEGTALGAKASMAIYHTDEAAAREAIAAGVAELTRLEGVFSLYRADSALVALNRQRALTDAPADLVALVKAAKSFSALSDGAFDPTVQPLWQTYFDHFTKPSPDPAGPPPDRIAHALSLVGWRGIEIDEHSRRVGLARPGMALTLNGIAQGYITDRVADMLRARGLERMLVDMGETRALATKPDGSAWRIGIANPSQPSALVTTIDVVDRAVATSGGYGTLFDEAGGFTHLIDPANGRTAPANAGVTVIAASAAKADALSTALSIAAPEHRQRILTAAGDVKALFVAPDGGVTTLEA